MAGIRLKKKSLVYQQGGGRVQNSGPWHPWLPVVENSQLFAQCAHSAGTAHGAPPLSIFWDRKVVYTLTAILLACFGLSGAYWESDCIVLDSSVLCFTGY